MVQGVSIKGAVLSGIFVEGGVALEVGVGVVLGVGVGVGVVLGVGVGLDIVTPLFQTNFLPYFTQVNFFPADTAVEPAFEQLAPAFGAAPYIGEVIANKKVIDRVKIRFLRIPKE